MKQKPLFLLDIDGVVNAFQVYKNDDSRKYKRTEANGYIITYKPEWAEWVEQLVAVSDARWATMWQANAATHFAPQTGIGLGIKAHIDFDKHQRMRSWQRTGFGVGNYKHPGIIATVGNRPFVWVDDDLTPELHAWARKRTESGIPTLLVQPDPSVGITSRQVATVHKFLVTHTA